MDFNDGGGGSCVTPESDNIDSIDSIDSIGRAATENIGGTGLALA